MDARFNSKMAQFSAIANHAWRMDGEVDSQEQNETQYMLLDMLGIGEYYKLLVQVGRRAMEKNT